ncbi:class GN sortase [Thaumasiovibrio subtropicus]|uniref:class GN sortase n=1 Tax=Thaumasiovibrio subtropicus TaxID=1891207 RepID=UPI000B358BF8|nr:class GN sortase [Thaumasiovibrio subtropicus]
MTVPNPTSVSHGVTPTPESEPEFQRHYADTKQDSAKIKQDRRARKMAEMSGFAAPMRWNITIWLCGIVLCFAIIMMGKGAYIQAKAWAAQWLITDAWQHQQTHGETIPPWPWADTYPVAALSLSENNEMMVLAGVSGRNLAFGPTLQLNTAQLGETGNVVIYGHNDTHFRHLEHLRQGDTLSLTDANNQVYQYRIERTFIAHESETHWVNQTDEGLLTLVTCYPFNTVTLNSDLRFIVRAVKLAS